MTRGVVVSTYRENGNKCRLTIAKKPVSSFIPIVQLLRKNSPYTKAISQQLNQIPFSLPTAFAFILLNFEMKSNILILFIIKGF